MKPKVLVLVAVYNGEKWLVEQLTSIINQKNVDIDVIINIDKSTDSSYKLCENFIADNVKILPYGAVFGGAGANFYHLIHESEFSGYDYIAFSDQDDIWFETKIYDAINRMHDYDAYSSNVIAFWENGKQCLIEKSQPQTEFDYFFEAAGPGCTYIVRQELALAFKYFVCKNYVAVNKVCLHDWLLYAFARERKYKWFIDPQPGMLYRQHSNNQVGANASLLGAIKRIKKIKDSWYRNEVKKIVNLTSIDNNLISECLMRDGYLSSLKLAFIVRKLRRRPRDQFAMFIALVLGWF
ncbi:glycosyltransferase [Escherichia coli]|uniref:Glycosyltransferase n=2 Tax=Escherichia coli TaxID=562 RepID=A0A400KCA1_ECOLX|nr:glycosyltransferase [Escherichia coli]EEZ9006360.1 glycosyltransferase [Escherichia coli O150]MEE1489836.1 glycosyltransferase [Shigella flexneri]EAC1948380.1 glycosyltransferase [Escherichia coli]EAC2125329.1 glycosyltransferase [Escherichia coli]EEU5471631.1 glycosyltransferase [Escherichia coli]